MTNYSDNYHNTNTNYINNTNDLFNIHINNNYINNTITNINIYGKNETQCF